MGITPGCNKPDSKCRPGGACSYCKRQMFGKKGGTHGGSTMYGRSHGSSREPRGASGHINPRTGQGHSTQYYDDGTRLSWDTDGSGDSNQHWTNQNKGKRDPGRHRPPGHAK